MQCLCDENDAETDACNTLSRTVSPDDDFDPELSHFKCRWVNLIREQITKSKKNEYGSQAPLKCKCSETPVEDGPDCEEDPLVGSESPNEPTDSVSATNESSHLNESSSSKRIHCAILAGLVAISTAILIWLCCGLLNGSFCASRGFCLPLGRFRQAHRPRPF
ncbi:hypothetical protein QAD02_005622 [Eretmocerus hayati]|uniref:Uncharacterized protein n=1 Tax=Eretmocerus hayati TaxID=131215 RepID=A0ACC2NT35_9HYME|nr:hypothetical protein QAD02_005622 [Eretmocerus hayati]